MKLRKFTANSMKDAIAKVKAELGADAMIVATREIRRGIAGSGVEVTAAIDDEAILPVPAIEKTPLPELSPSNALSLSDDDIARIMAPIRSELRSIRAQIPAQMPVAPEPVQPVQQDNTALEAELSSMRAAIARLTHLQRAPRPTNLSTLAKSSVIAAPPTCRAIALVGPTGAGKTTTIAKIAAREALVLKKSVALVTLDTYRIGGEDQIRIFADLIGVPLIVVPAMEQLRPAFDKLASYDRVLIDTAGRSPRDRAVIDSMVRRLRGIGDLETHLVLPASTHGSMIDAWFGRYGAANIDRFLFTKLDEATDLSELVEAPARTQRPVSFVTTGQRVPEDIEDASWGRLLQLAEQGLEEAAA